ncbi:MULTISPECIES: fimbrial protein [Pseudomonas]|uniref:fimbrial protein n=1 Tax=Pseudomonas TaxID=286 RepID=UPI0010BF9C9B|nr:MULTISPECIES: fimbrial protein [Pseudomonas]MBD8193369.1 fimbrial protein [Pseudomonas fluorescens]MBD8228543.1 fimbrial protein [Pseudomonas fluorescens]MBD8737904.1 fimbrial protein [Pseudomonas fluorescens]MBD8786514.1 fimbrial protein [Pseudomonas fluorescens]MBD8818386.1 fimbrial protein [Pseudomonas fluorescens]
MINNTARCSALCASSLLMVFAATVNAADGQVEFTGSVNDNACTIMTDSVSKTVSLGQVQLSSFAAAVGSTANATPFSISLENCSTSTKKNVAITFSGQQDLTDATLLGLTGSGQVSGLAIQINDARTGTKLPLNTPTTDYVLRPQSNTYDFTAAYVRTAADTVDSDGNVTASGIGTGQVYALASFDVTYK